MDALGNWQNKNNLRLNLTICYCLNISQCQRVEFKLCSALLWYNGKISTFHIVLELYTVHQREEQLGGVIWMNDPNSDYSLGRNQSLKFSRFKKTAKSPLCSPVMCWVTSNDLSLCCTLHLPLNCPAGSLWLLLNIIPLVLLQLWYKGGALAWGGAGNPGNRFGNWFTIPGLYTNILSWVGLGEQDDDLSDPPELYPDSDSRCCRGGNMRSKTSTQWRRVARSGTVNAGCLKISQIRCRHSSSWVCCS